MIVLEELIISKKNKMRRQIIALAIIFAAILPASVMAETSTINEQIAALQAQIASLQAQLKALQEAKAPSGHVSAAESAEMGTDVSSSTGKWCHTFNTNMGRGYKGEEVSALAKALSNEGLIDGDRYVYGAVSADGVALDSDLSSAISKFQEKYIADILSKSGLTRGTGYLGLSTRNALNRIYGCNPSPRPVPPPKPPVPPVSTTGVTIISPNGGESWTIGSKQLISWKNDSRYLVDISLVTNCPDTDCLAKLPKTYQLASNVSNITQENFPWIVGKALDGQAIPAGSYTVKICNTLTKECDSSDSYFKIVSGDSTASTQVTVLSPNGGESYAVGSTITFRWVTKGVGQNPVTQLDINDTRTPGWITRSLFGAVPAQNHARLVATDGDKSTFEYAFVVPANFDDSLPSQYKGIFGGNYYKANVTIVTAGQAGTASQTTISDSSDNYFKIVSNPDTHQGTGVLNVTKDVSSPLAQTVLAGATNVSALAIKLTATGENLVISELPLTYSGKSGVIASLSLFDGGTQIGSGVFAGDLKVTKIYPISSIVIPKDSSKTLTLKVDIAGSAPLGPVGAGDTMSLGIEQIKAIGQTSQLDAQTTYLNGSVWGSGVTMWGDTITIFKAIPTFASVPLSNQTLNQGSDITLMRFKVSSSAQGDTSLHKLTVLAKTAGVNLSNVNIYGYTDSAFSQPVSGVGVAGALAQVGKAPNSIGEVSIYVQSSAGNKSMLVVPAGQARYFEVRGSVSNLQAGGTVSTSLLFDNTAPATDIVNSAEKMDTAPSRVIWSPNTRTTSALTDIDWANSYLLPSRIINATQVLIGSQSGQTVASTLPCPSMIGSTPITRGDAACFLVTGSKMIVSTFGGPHFTDVAITNPNYSYIETLYNRAVTSGCSTGKFCPSDYLTRGQAMVQIVRARGYALENPAVPRFSDVPTTHPYYKYIETAAKNGLVTGYNGKFMPEDPILSGDLTTVITKAFTQ